MVMFDAARPALAGQAEALQAFPGCRWRISAECFTGAILAVKVKGTRFGRVLTRYLRKLRRKSSLRAQGMSQKLQSPWG